MIPKQLANLFSHSLSKSSNIIFILKEFTDLKKKLIYKKGVLYSILTIAEYITAMPYPYRSTLIPI